MTMGDFEDNLSEWQENRLYQLSQQLKRDREANPKPSPESEPEVARVIVAQGVWRNFGSSWAHCKAIAKALNQYDPSYNASAEIGGGGSVYVNADLDANRWMYWGTVNENWGGDVLEMESGEPLNLYIETGVSTEEADAQKVAGGIHAAIIEFLQRQG